MVIKGGESSSNRALVGSLDSFPPGPKFEGRGGVNLCAPQNGLCAPGAMLDDVRLEDGGRSCTA